MIYFFRTKFYSMIPILRPLLRFQAPLVESINLIRIEEDKRKIFNIIRYTTKISLDVFRDDLIFFLESISNKPIGIPIHTIEKRLDISYTDRIDFSSWKFVLMKESKETYKELQIEIEKSSKFSEKIYDLEETLKNYLRIKPKYIANDLNLNFYQQKF